MALIEIGKVYVFIGSVWHGDKFRKVIDLVNPLKPEDIPSVQEMSSFIVLELRNGMMSWAKEFFNAHPDFTFPVEGVLDQLPNWPMASGEIEYNPETWECFTRYVDTLDEAGLQYLADMQEGR